MKKSTKVALATLAIAGVILGSNSLMSFTTPFKGQGYVLVPPNVTITGSYKKVVFTEYSSINSLSGINAPKPANEVPANFYLEGTITSISLSSGYAVAYNQ